MANELSKTYNPQEVEEQLYEWWESQGYFAPKIDPGKKPFVIVIPPPNVTGELHHGHAMFITFEDLLIRWRRMRGEPTLWLPGTDHAGIATQTVVERFLGKQGKKRKDLGRDEFVKVVWEWKEEYGGIITRQLRRMGASVDWTRERFTMDAQLSRAVRAAFVQLYQKGLIYRGPRLVNWCPKDETAISDLEVDHKEAQSKLYYVRYPLAEGDGYIVVATTRPETMLGDSAVAVNPEDARYKHLIGHRVILPAVGRRIQIIADESVDMAFGTGAVKVTPAHDPTDYEMGQRHDLQFINIMNVDGTINENGGIYAGMERYAARKKLLADLEREGLVDHIEDYTHSVGHCQRCGTVIEPLISTQWFLKMKPLAEPAIQVVKTGELKIVPERFNKIYYQWMENIRDWCISRQLWWGHRIPVWYCENGHMTCQVTDPGQCATCGSTDLRQDEDVLDTWFSSGLWPFSTLGWPEDTEDLRYFYPTSVLETGYDILFFWVARMVMMGLECTGKIPFHTIYLHGLMRDEKGEKMSKSKGNTANPLDIVRDYGTDALRMTIVTGSAPGADMKLFPEKLEQSRNFANKIWNAARFVISNLGDESELLDWPFANLDKLSLADHWIISRLHRTVNEVNQQLEDYRFNDAGQAIYHFLWDEYCDWYIEASKVTLNGGDAEAKRITRSTLRYVLDQALRLLHPMMPYVTEEIWQHLPHQGPSLMLAQWPYSNAQLFTEAEEAFATIMATVTAIRNARSEFKVEPARRIPAILAAGQHATSFESQRESLVTLARLDPDKLQIMPRLAAKPSQAYATVVEDIEIYLPLAGMIDLDKEKARLTGELDKARADVQRTEAKLNGDFGKRAPAQVIERERERLSTVQERIAKLEEQLAGLSDSKP
ncbi:MAG: valine--tRNA ligase [Anaerolineae bacterium]